MHYVPTYDLFVLRGDKPCIAFSRSSALPDVSFLPSAVVIEAIAEEKRGLFPGLVGNVYYCK